MTNRCDPFVALGAALLILGATGSALAQDTWRIAGTFNQWRTDDPDWTLRPLEGQASTMLSLERDLEPGVYEFKFVRNGDWEDAHLGATHTRGGLEQPGEHIRMHIYAPATYQILLDPTRRIWRYRPRGLDKPVLVLRTLGVPMQGHIISLDYSRSLAHPILRPNMLSIGVGSAPIKVLPANPGDTMVRLELEQVGSYDIVVALTDRNARVEQALRIDVEPATEIALLYPGHDLLPEFSTFEPQSDSTLRGMIELFGDAQLSSLQVRRGEKTLARERDVSLAGGTYAAEIVDGELVRHDRTDLPDFLLPGNWRRFEYAPSAPVDRVHVIGDFNGWAMPGEPGAIELHPQGDGLYAAIVDLPEGVHEYQFLIDGQYREFDRTSSDRIRDEDGTVRSVIEVGLLPDEFAPARPDHIDLDAVRHDPALASDFTPISRGLGLADVSLRTLPGDVDRVTLIVDPPTAESPMRLPLSSTVDSLGYDRWSSRLMIGSAQWQYSFEMTDGLAREVLGPFHASVEPAFETPDWAKGAVWYQIFAERFRNGNPANDPHGPGVFPMQWTDDWYAISDAEAKRWRERYGVPAGEPFPPRRGGPLYHVVWDRRYGGDLQGVLDELDHLAQLGVDVIYLNPVFEAESMHKYDATDYRHIDDNFATPAGPVPGSWTLPDGEDLDPATWTWTASDRFFIEQFLPECRARGIRVVIDGVFNHTGRAFFAFQDLEHNGRASRYEDWYIAEFDDEGRLARWESWDGGGALPKFRQNPDGDLVDPVRNHIFDITRRWMDPNGDGDPADGVDGWRLDVPMDVGLPFWADWSRLVKSINPDAIIVAEIWDEADTVTSGNYFDTSMHYPFARAVSDWLGVRPGMTASALAVRLEAVFDDAPQTSLIHQNLLDSHDTDRFVSMLQNPNRAYDHGNRPQDHEYPYRDTRPVSRTYALAWLGAAIQATYLGAPMIYYGDELGMWGADDPTNRKPVPWPDLGPMARADDSPNLDALAAYRRWFALRRDETLGPILRYGSVHHLDAGNDDVFAFDRELNGTRARVVVNRGETAFDAASMLIDQTDSVVPPLSARLWLLTS